MFLIVLLWVIYDLGVLFLDVIFIFFRFLVIIFKLVREEGIR